MDRQTAMKLEELRQRLCEISDLHAAEAVLYWDQATYMPAGGAAARGRQLATLTELAHQKLTDPALGLLLDQLEPALADLPYDDDNAALLRVTRRQIAPAALLCGRGRHGAQGAR